MDANPFNKFEVKRTILKPFEVEKRVIYPVLEISTFFQGFNLINISPVALIVEEDEDKYILQLTFEEIDENELFELFYSFKNKRG